jgi:hypothetical protein
LGVAENIHHIDRLGNIRQSLEECRAVNALACEAWIDADHLVAPRKKIGKNDVGRLCLLIRRANHRNGFHRQKNIAQKGVGVIDHKPCLWLRSGLIKPDVAFRKRR